MIKSSSQRLSRRLSMSFLTLVLGAAAIQTWDRQLTEWNFCLLGIAVTSLVFWLRTPNEDLAPPLERWLSCLILAYPVYVAWQLVPLPAFLLQILSPERFRVLDSLKGVMPRPSFAALSVDPATTFEYLVRILGYLLVFLLVRNISWRSRERGYWTAVIPLLVIACAEAAMGILQYNEGLRARGTYRNRNHFAGLIEMALPVCIGYAVALYNGDYRPLPLSRALKACAMLVVSLGLLAAIFYSFSKMGFVATVGAFLAMATLAAAARLSGGSRVVAGVGLLLCAVLVFIFLPSDQLVRQFSGAVSTDGTVDLEARWPIWGNTLRLIADYPVFGCGLGAYGTAFLKYQTAAIDRNFAFAHNDYLEYIAELGAAGVWIPAVFLLAIFLRAVRAATNDHDPNTRYLGLGCAGALTAILVHSIADFNSYVRINGLAMAWVVGLTASLPAAAGSRKATNAFPSRAQMRKFAIAVTCLLLIYAPAWIVFSTYFRTNPIAEKRFCRFGICDTNSVITAQIQGSSLAMVPIADLQEMVRRNATDPVQWDRLGEASMLSGNLERARYSFAQALGRAPNVPPILWTVADFHANIQETPRALSLISRVLAGTADYDLVLFEWFGQKSFAGGDILKHALAGNPRASRAYLNYLMQAGNLAEASKAWSWMLSQGYVDQPMANGYVDFLLGHKKEEAAAKAWGAYLGDKRYGYPESNLVFNGDFELPPSGSSLDWVIHSPEGANATLDASVANSGSHSLRVQFEGKQNISFSHVGQTLFITGGTYRLQAFIRTQDLTTSQGVGFQIFDADASSPLNVFTENVTGTNGWKKIEQIIRVPRESRALKIQVVRRPVEVKFDKNISGTAWVDSVKLTRVP